MNGQIPPNHPRAQSLHIRHKLVNGFKDGLVVAEGLIAHGRGEAFDYLLGERTSDQAAAAIQAAAASILLSKYPVISVNGNVAALCSKDVASLEETANLGVEVNLFYRTADREMAIERQLIKNGVRRVMGVGEKASAIIPELFSDRRRVDPDGIYKADTVFVPLEDGDRTHALVRIGKKVITADLNPMSRTAVSAHISIIDNIVRVMPLLVLAVQELKTRPKDELEMILENFDNKSNLEESLKKIRTGAQVAKSN